jgi:hypothetical protein
MKSSSGRPLAECNHDVLVGAVDVIGALGFVTLHFGEGVEVLGREVLGQSCQLLGTQLALGLGEFFGQALNSTGRDGPARGC